MTLVFMFEQKDTYSAQQCQVRTLNLCQRYKIEVFSGIRATIYLVPIMCWEKLTKSVPNLNLVRNATILLTEIQRG